MSANLFQHDFGAEVQLRKKIKGHDPLMVWLTGLSGSGKTTLAKALEKRLLEQGFHTFLLDGDNLRNGLNAGLGFSDDDRKENLRRVAEVGRLFLDAGIIAIGAFVSPLEAQRNMVRETIGLDQFYEVHVNTPLSICEQRDVNGLYKKARAGAIENFTGISAPYQEPESPNIRINTNDLSVKEAVQLLYDGIISKVKQ